MSEREVTIPSSHEMYVSGVRTDGDFEYGHSMGLRVNLQMALRRRIPPEVRSARLAAFHAESLPQSLALLLAQMSGAPLQVLLVRPSLVDWHVTSASLLQSAFSGTTLDMDFETSMLTRPGGGRLNWHRSDWTPPEWFKDAIRDFVGPLFSIEGLT